MSQRTGHVRDIFFRPCHEQRIRKPRGSERLAQMPRWQHPLLQIRHRYEQQIDVSLQLHMLKAIIQDAHGDPELPLREHARDVAIARHEYWNAGHGARQQLRLVAGTRDRFEDTLAIAHDEDSFGRFAAGISAREDRGTLSAVAEETGNGRHNGRLAAATGREIAYADDGMMQTPPALRTARVPGAAHPGDAAVCAAE